MVRADGTTGFLNLYNLIFLSFLLLLQFLGSQFSSELFDVGLFLAVPPGFSSSTTAKPSWDPVLVDAGLLHVDRDIKLIDFAAVTSGIGDLSGPLLVKLDESVAPGLASFGVSDHSNALDLSEGLELSAQSFIIRFVIQISDENCLVGFAFNFAVILGPVIFDRLFLSFQVVNHFDLFCAFFLLCL